MSLDFTEGHSHPADSAYDHAEQPPVDWMPLAALMLAALAAGLAEYIIRQQESALVGVALYGAAILLIAVTSLPFRLRATHSGAQSLPRLGWVILLCGAAGSIVLAVYTFSRLRRDTGDELAFWFWIASLLPLLVSAAVVWRAERPADLWRAETPGTRNGLLAFWLSAFAVIVVAALVRLLWLDSVPFGINPDEGDRAAVAIQVVRNTTPNGVFEAGWYYISMLYFELMALAFNIVGIGFVQARAFTALFGIAGVAITIWIGARQWSWRVGLLAGVVAASTGVILQFSRLTTEAGPTATLWLLSLGLMLEGARRGRSLPWALAGMTGGFGLYFYPTGRVWALLATLIGIYLLVRWLVAKRGETVALARGLGLAAISALVIATPYLAWIVAHPHELTLRYVQTTVFDPVNAARLGYVDPEWSTLRLLLEQMARTLGIVNHYSDGGGVWPIDLPILSPLLALFVLVGVGITTLRLRDVRGVALALAFWVGISGVVATVETPNLIRMATAIPLFALLAAVVLEEAIVRLRSLFMNATSRARAEVVSFGVALILVIAAGYAEMRYYFNDYAQMNLWQGANQEGRALHLLPEDTLYTSVGTSFHMINSGWVRLLAPEAERAGIKHPGSAFPIPPMGTRDLGVLLYPDQSNYLQWLKTLYPEAQEVRYELADEPTYFTLLHVPNDALAKGWDEFASGTLAHGLLGTVEIDGETPQNRIDNTLATCCIRDLLETHGRPTKVTWRGNLTAPSTGEYHFSINAPASGALTIDGEPVLHVVEGGGRVEGTIMLDAGAHAIEINLALPHETNGALELAWAPPGDAWSILPHTVLEPPSDWLGQPQPAILPEEDRYEVVR